MADQRHDPVPLALSDDLGLLVSRLGTVARVRIAESLSPLGLTMRQFAVLRALGAEEGLSQAALGERLKIDASSIVSVLDDCQQSGWTERRPDPADRRRYAIHLTPSGRRTLVRALAAASRAQEEIFAPLNASQRKTLHKLLLLLVGERVVSSPPERRAARKTAAGR
ncbi:MAG TPA: MarR family transcriptional regulator [Actinomycetota bacterium]|nr:MarR family transcriptional regulator [Actinomycetota bacterium]